MIQPSSDILHSVCSGRTARLIIESRIWLWKYKSYRDNCFIPPTYLHIHSMWNSAQKPPCLRKTLSRLKSGPSISFLCCEMQKMENEQSSKRKEYLWVQVIQYNPRISDCFTGTDQSNQNINFSHLISCSSVSCCGICAPGVVLQMCWALRQNPDQATECFCTREYLAGEGGGERWKEKTIRDPSYLKLNTQY